MTATPSKTAAKRTRKSPAKPAPLVHEPTAADKELLSKQLDKGLTPTLEEQEDAAGSQMVPSTAFSLAESCGGGKPVAQRSEVDAMILLGDASKYAGYQPGIGIHICVGDNTVIPSNSDTPNQLDGVKVVGLGLKPMTYNGTEYFKLNVFLETRDKKVLLGTTGLTTVTSKGILSAVRYLHENNLLDQPFTFSVKQGNTPTTWLVNCCTEDGRGFYDPTFWPDLRNADDQLEILKTEVNYFSDVFNGVKHVSVLEELRTPALPEGDAE